MRGNRYTFLLTLTSIVSLCVLISAQQRIGETPAITVHMDETDIETGRVSFQQIVEHGRTLFTAVFNRLDGQGRTTTMSRTAGPEAHSCVACHNRPRAGGGGDFPTNVFMM